MFPPSKSVDNKSKHIGQVFTPDYIVSSILEYCDYSGAKILEKHIIDNSCGDGAFLRKVVRTYIEAALSSDLPKTIIKRQLQTYIHGIDTDKAAYDACLENLTAIASEYGIEQVKWDLYNTSSLSHKKFDGKMDYVVGNPPYVRVHNLDSTYDEVKTYRFANGGMTDLYLAFFELGFNMLKPTGKLCYITPSSWLNSVAAENMRAYIMQNKNMVALVDLEHFQAFEHATAYTMISLFSKSHKSEVFDYYTYNGKTHERIFVENLKLTDIYIDSYFYLSTSENLRHLREIKTKAATKYISVKNGFATLADSVFIGESLPSSKITIKTLKASTGKWYDCIFPYDKDGKPLPEDEIFANKEIKQHFLKNKDVLLKGRPEYKGWYLYGRTQALLDVNRQKLSVNPLIRDEKDFKLIELKAGEGIYSGLYIITDFNIGFDVIKSIIKSPDFVTYVRTLKKYKSGGYYTFNTKDIEQYINWYLTFKSNNRYVKQSAVSGQDQDLFQGVY